jgi:hypothetical protein
MAAAIGGRRQRGCVRLKAVARLEGVRGTVGEQAIGAPAPFLVSVELMAAPAKAWGAQGATRGAQNGAAFSSCGTADDTLAWPKPLGAARYAEVVVKARDVAARSWLSNGVGRAGSSAAHREITGRRERGAVATGALDRDPRKELERRTEPETTASCAAGLILMRGFVDVGGCPTKRYRKVAAGDEDRLCERLMHIIG